MNVLVTTTIMTFRVCPFGFAVPIYVSSHEVPLANKIAAKRFRFKEKVERHSCMR